MGGNIFVTSSLVAPTRWRQAFPQAKVVPILPANTPEGTLVWLHNFTPAQLPAGVRPAGVRFVVMYDEPSDQGGLAALAQGAVGFCNSHATPEQLHTIESVVRNQGLWIGESLLNRVIGDITARMPGAEKQHNHALLQLLSERERQVVLCVVRGDSNKEIARKLDLAERTVKSHLTGAFEKLKVRDRLQLALVINTPE